jgi:hypothetical protein
MKSLGKKPDGARLERIKASPRWAGDRFHNVHTIAPGLRDPNASMPSIGDFLCGGERRVPRGPLPSVNPLQSWLRASDSGLRATWLGHSTVLIEIDGFRVLTDLGSVGHSRGTHHGTRLVGIAQLAAQRAYRDRRAFAAFLRARAQGPQCHIVVLVRHSLGAPRGILQR